MPLTDNTCKNAKPKTKSYKLADAFGMYLEVMPNGSKYWRLKYRISGKEKRLAIGVYPEVPLAVARAKCIEAKKLIKTGQDPIETKRIAQRSESKNAENTFFKVTTEWHENRKDNWTPKYASTLLRRIELDLFPFLENRPINEITSPELLGVLRKIETRGAIDIAHRAQQTAGQIFRYAIATGRADRDPSADLKGALKPWKKKHYAYLSAKELPEYIEKLKGYQGDAQTKHALQLLLLTFVRTTELRGAFWSEIDLDKAEWRIPADRMKMRDPHIVPLSKQAIEILKQQLVLSKKSTFVFPGHNATKYMSENTMIYALYRMGYHSRATGHGFRATASTILNELGYRSDVIERQLAHSERNSVRAAYNHAQLLPERKKLMQEWADHLDYLCKEAEKSSTQKEIPALSHGDKL